MTSHLSEHLAAFTSGLHALAAGETSWSNIVIVEESAVTRQGRHLFIPRTALTTPEDYAARFDEFMDRGFHWLNMTTLGVVSGTLVVVIELPHYVSEIKGRTSINFSGPPLVDGKAQWIAEDEIRFADEHGL